jgi:hypothetical protein
MNSSDVVIKSTMEELLNVLEPETSKEPEAIKEPEASKEPEAIKEPETSKEPEAIKETEASEEPGAKTRDKSPIRRKPFRLQVDDDEIISRLFLTSSTIDSDKKAFGNQRYMEGYMEAQSLERDEILSAIEQVRQLCVKTHTERLGKPILDRTCDGVANVTMDEPTRFVRYALAHVPTASDDVIDEPR